MLIMFAYLAQSQQGSSKIGSRLREDDVFQSTSLFRASMRLACLAAGIGADGRRTLVVDARVDLFRRGTRRLLRQPIPD